MLHEYFFRKFILQFYWCWTEYSIVCSLVGSIDRKLDSRPFPKIWWSISAWEEVFKRSYSYLTLTGPSYSNIVKKFQIAEGVSMPLVASCIMHEEIKLKHSASPSSDSPSLFFRLCPSSSSSSLGFERDSEEGVKSAIDPPPRFYLYVNPFRLNDKGIMHYRAPTLPNFYPPFS